MAFAIVEITDLIDDEQLRVGVVLHLSTMRCITFGGGQFTECMRCRREEGGGTPYQRFRCPVCYGITVQFPVEWVSTLPWNTQSRQLCRIFGVDP